MLKNLTSIINIFTMLIKLVENIFKNKVAVDCRRRKKYICTKIPINNPIFLKSYQKSYQYIKPGFQHVYWCIVKNLI